MVGYSKITVLRRNSADVFSAIEGDTTNDGFSLLRSRAGMRGAASEKLSFFVLTELARTPVTAPTSGGARLLDAQINLRIEPELNLRVGQFIHSLTRTWQPAAFSPWIDHTDIEKSVWFFHRQGDTEATALRDLGVSVWGEHAPGSQTLLSYEAGIVNGSGLSQRDEVDHDLDAFVALRAAQSLFHLKVGAWMGSRGSGAAELGHKKWVASVGWGDDVKSPYWVAAGYMGSTQEQPAGTDSIFVQGGYMALGWSPHTSTRLTYRFSLCECEENLGPPGPRNSRVHSVTAAYHIHKHVRLLSQYDYRTDTLGVVPNAEGHAFRAILSLPFAYTIRD